MYPELRPSLFPSDGEHRTTRPVPEQGVCPGHSFIPFFIKKKLKKFFLLELLLILSTANVDEVFIDLCRQMLRRDDTYDAHEGDDYHSKHDHGRSGHPRRRRRKKDRRDRHC